MSKKTDQNYFIIACIAALLFFPLIGMVHLFDWDEINFAEAAREMLVTHNYTRVQINFQPFWEKPPLFFWMQALSMKIFGVNEFAARFPDAVIGVATLLFIYGIGKNLYSKTFGLFWAFAMAGCVLPHLYFKSGIIDPVFNFFIFGGIYFFNCYIVKKSLQQKELHFSFILFAGIFLGLAVLTKGPVGYLIFLLSFLVYTIGRWKYADFLWKEFLAVSFIALIISFAWFGPETIQHGFWFLKEFIVYQIRLFTTQDAGHGGNFFYHWYILLIGCFPASLIFFFTIRKINSENYAQQNFRYWMIILFWVVLLLFSIVQTKIVHYSSLCYLPLTFLTATVLTETKKNTNTQKKYFVISASVIGVLLASVFILFPIIGMHTNWLLPFLKDPFAQANLQANVSWNYSECLIGIGYLLFLIAAVIYFTKGEIKKSFVLFFINNIIVTQLALYLFVPKIEQYSQGAAIGFFQSLQNKNVYVHPLGYKTYADLFYAQKKPGYNLNSLNENWLLTGKIDKPVYFICKNTYLKNVSQYKQLKQIGSKNGFVFFERMPEDSTENFKSR
jgi:4-amino-4-deoxy-L-arabinose transferase-like glycosyltransferase